MKSFTYSNWLLLANKFKDIIYLLEQNEDLNHISLYEKGIWYGISEKKDTFLKNSNSETYSIFYEFISALESKNREKILENAKAFYNHLLILCPDKNRAYRENNFPFSYKERIEHLSPSWKWLDRVLDKISSSWFFK
ncbi:hypothetical protein KKH36_03720 [Patescibacteria group bacterium]|nr:hypothetical protein [Patescibacteria group bacterium]